MKRTQHKLGPPTALQGAAAGAIGAVVALACTFPLATAKTRLQAQRKRRERGDGAAQSSARQYAGTFDVITKIVRHEGWSRLYAGLVPALTKAASVNFVFYYFFELLRPLFAFLGRKGKSGALRLLSSLLHGMASGVCVQIVTLPSDLVVTRLMASGSTAGYVETFRRVVESDGILALWDGLAPGLSLTVNPGITTLIRNVLGGATDSAKRNFFIGLFSKATASTLTYPWTICKVQMQIEGLRREESCDESDKPTMRQVIARIVEESGFAGLYVGLWPQLTNAMLKEAMLNMVRLEIMKVVVYGSRLLWSSARAHKG
eukprot:g203.t1